MALSMDEQRVLAEIERRLAAEEPGLAACLTNFRRPGPAAALRSPRARIIGSLFTVLLVATISLMVYAMIPFRAVHTTRAPAGRPGSAPGQAQITATGPGSPGSSPGTVTVGTSASQATRGTASTAANANATDKSSAGTKASASGPTAAVRSAATAATKQQAKAKTSGTSADNR
jgi:hypothetical protein